MIRLKRTEEQLFEFACQDTLGQARKIKIGREVTASGFCAQNQFALYATSPILFHVVVKCVVGPRSRTSLMI